MGLSDEVDKQDLKQFYDNLEVKKKLAEEGCPEGKVQVAFVSCYPDVRLGKYSWAACDSARIEIKVDGKVFQIEFGTLYDGRRGININGFGEYRSNEFNSSRDHL